MLHRAALLVSLAGSLAACAGSDAQLRVDYAPDFDHRPLSVSIIGAYQSGLLRTDTWADLAPSLEGAFAGPACEPLYSKELDAMAPSLASAIDHYTQANGVSDELLRELAPAASTDTLMLVAVGEHLEASVTSDGAPAASIMPARRGTPIRPAATPRTQATTNAIAIDLSVSFYSIKTRHLVAQMDMTSTGRTQDEAIRRFATELRAQFPSTTCAGWKRDVALDESKIEAMAEAARP